MAHRVGRAAIPFAAAGDLLMYLVATPLGLASHRELGLAATWIPFGAAWFAIAPWLGLFDPGRLRRSSALGRVLVGSLLAAPAGAWLKSLWLGSEVVGIFVLVMAGSTAALMLLWRALFGFALRKAGTRV